MALDLERLLGSFGEDEPSGPDCEYETEFSDLTIAAQSKGDQQVGDQVIEAEEADYSEVMKLAPKLLERTKDLRVAVMLAEANLNRSGFGGFNNVLEYIRGALENYWDSVHPQLDADDDDDPTERVNALLGLMDDQGMLYQMRRAALTDGKVMGRYTLRHVAVTKGEMTVPSDMDETPDAGSINAAFQDTPEDKMQEIRDGISNSLAHVSAIEALLDDKVPGRSPDFDPLRKLLTTASNAVNAALGGTVEVAPEVAENTGGGTVAAAPVKGGSVSGINNQTDVKTAIDLILDYYKRAEPSSPVPLILARARRLVGADFMTIVQDMAATAEDEVRTIGGNPAEDQY